MAVVFARQGKQTLERAIEGQGLESVREDVNKEISQVSSWKVERFTALVA